VHKNELEELPESIGRLTRLASLDIRNNKIASLPFSIAKLSVVRPILSFSSPFLPTLFG